MTAIPEFADARLVAIYDVVNPYDADAQPGFYARLADEVDARVVVELGCGTGLVTQALVRTGPAPELIYISVSDSQPSGGAARRQHCSGTGAASRSRTDQSDSSASSWDA